MKPIKSTLLSLLLLYSAHTVYAEDWDGKSPIWLSAQSDKLRFSIWDKHSVYDKYDITYMVGLKGGRPDYFIAKRSHMKGESPELSQVVFPDDFEDNIVPGPAHSLGDSDIVWSIYVNDKLVMSGINGGSKTTQLEINGKLVQFKKPR